MAQIYCNKCNQKFKSMLGFLHHDCPLEGKSVKWGEVPGSSGSSIEKYWKKREKNGEN